MFLLNSSYDNFGTIVKLYEIFSYTDDIQAIVSRHVETVALMSKVKE